MNLDFRSEAGLMGATSYRAKNQRADGALCVDCRFSLVFAAQPRAVCKHPAASLSGRVLFAGQPACVDYVAHVGPDLRMGVAMVMRGAGRAAAIVH